MKNLCIGSALLIAVWVQLGCESEDECTVDTSYKPTIDAKSFSSAITNQFLPLTPGTRSTFKAGSEEIVVSVTRNTKQVLGVTCVEVRDTVSVGGQTIEDTLDWYAQDSAGNVWYLGEDTKEYEGGKVVSTEGSWTAGVDGAQPGIVMKASPRVGDKYKQEYYACEAEDLGEVVSVNESVTVPAGSYTGCVKTRDTSAIEPDLDEYKLYCPKVGMTLELDPKTGARLVELVKVETF